MKIKISENAGFCPGVKRADTTVRSLISKKSDKEKIYTLGSLIHNSIYNDELRSMGVIPIDFDEIEKILSSQPEFMHTLVIRTHGITKEQNEKIIALKKKYQNFSPVDMTCPSVKKIHRIAAENTSDETCFLLFCNPKHVQPF